MTQWESVFPTAPADAVDALYMLERRLEALEDTLASGYGTPEGAVVGRKGRLYRRLDGGTATCLYVYEGVNDATTGWAAK